MFSGRLGLRHETGKIVVTVQNGRQSVSEEARKSAPPPCRANYTT